MEVRGAVYNIPNFNRYQIEAGTGATATQFQIVDGPFGAQQTDPNSFLGRWDTTSIPDGQYTVRLFAVDNQGHHAQIAVPVIVNNQGAAIQPPTAAPINPVGTVQPNFNPTQTPLVINPAGPTALPALTGAAPTTAPTIPPTQGALPPTTTLRPVFPPTPKP
jgi:hypothetical protein